MHSLDDVRKELEKINLQLGIYNKQLEEHMKQLEEHMLRTKQVEDQIKKHDKVFSFIEIGFKLTIALGVITTVAKNIGWL